MAPAAAASAAARTWVALVHHPVLDRGGQVIATAITNLDIHDIARASRTFGLAGYFLVTPIAAQRDLAQRILGHWSDGAGREHNDKRTDALSLVRVAATLAEAQGAIVAATGKSPQLIATGAREREKVTEFTSFAADPERPLLLVFGTGWGLAPEVMDTVDVVLAPIRGAGGPGSYNHLSVRSAVAIVLDRLFGR